MVRQLKMDRWSNGRVILTGDAAWCATPLSGIGTTLAIVGGYVLANELARTPDLAASLAGYERAMRPFVKEGQGVPKIVLRLLWPHTRTGVSILHPVMRLVSAPAFRKFFAAALVRNARDVKPPPDYSNAGGAAKAPERGNASKRRLRTAVATIALKAVAASIWASRRASRRPRHQARPTHRDLFARSARR